MGLNVVTVHDLRLVDPYMFRTDYFMGLSKRLAKFLDANNSEQELHSYALELFHYVTFGYDLNIVPQRVYWNVRELLDEEYFNERM